jgi:hypothetical protein
MTLDKASGIILFYFCILFHRLVFDKKLAKLYIHKRKRKKSYQLTSVKDKVSPIEV